MTDLARARGVSYRYGAGVAAVSDVDLEVRPEEIVAVIGPNGAGKSTLLRLMTRRLRPSAGAVEAPPSGLGPDGTVALGHADEETAHFEPLSGFHNACFFARASGLGTEAAVAAVLEHFAILGLSEHAHAPVSTYSYGNRRKLALAEAMAHRPRFLVLDEPTSGLDTPSRDAAARLLEARRREGAGVLMVSHDLDLVMDLASRIVLLHEGGVVAEGRPRELLSALVGAVTRIEITLDAPAIRPVASFGPDVDLVEEGDRIVLETSRGQAALPHVCSVLLDAGARMSGIEVREAGLAEVVRRVTGRAVFDRDRA